MSISIRDYISSKFASIGIVPTDADFMDMGILYADQCVKDPEDIYKRFLQYIPSLLLRPTSISEGGTSITRASRADIEAFYSRECKRLGLKNELSKKPKVKFR